MWSDNKIFLNFNVRLCLQLVLVSTDVDPVLFEHSTYEIYSGVVPLYMYIVWFVIV